MKLFGEQKMFKPSILRGLIFAFSAASASFVLVPGASASPQIQSKAILLKVIPAPTTANNCMGCHTVGSAKADIPNLKPGYQTAYKADTNGLTKLKALLNVLPTTSVGLVGSGLAKTDIYEVYCVTGAASLSASVKSLSSSTLLSKISIQVTKGTAASPVSTDSVNGNTAYSPTTKLAGGTGPYNVKVTKSAYTGTVATQKGPMTYTGQLSCATSTGAPTGIAWRIIQNQ